MKYRNRILFFIIIIFVNKSFGLICTRNTLAEVWEKSSVVILGKLINIDTVALFRTDLDTLFKKNVRHYNLEKYTSLTFKNTENLKSCSSQVISVNTVLGEGILNLNDDYIVFAYPSFGTVKDTSDSNNYSLFFFPCNGVIHYNEKTTNVLKRLKNFENKKFRKNDHRKEKRYWRRTRKSYISEILSNSEYFFKCKTMFDVYDVTCLDPWREHILKPSKIWIKFKPKNGTRDFKNIFEFSMTFDIDSNKTISSDLLPDKVLNTLKEIYKTSFIQQSLTKYKVKSISLYSKNSALYSKENYEKVKFYKDVLLKHGINTPPEEDWVQVNVEIKKDNGDLDLYGFVYPIKTDLFIYRFTMLKENIWYDNFRKLAQKYYTEDKEPNPEDFCIIMKKEGELNLIPLFEKDISKTSAAEEI